MKNILYLGNKLEKHGISPTSADILPELFEKAGFEVKVASEKKNEFLRFLDITRHLLKFTKSSDYVLIDTYSTRNFYIAIWVGFWCTVLKTKYIPILRGGNLQYRLENNRLLSRFFFGKSFTNVAPSRFFQKTFANYNIPNIEYIPNNIVLKNYQFRSRKKVSPKLLWVRAYAEIYNPVLSLKVLERLLKEYPETEFCMVGPDKDGCLHTIKNVIREKDLPVIVKGKLNKIEWTDLSKEYDVFLNTTNIDNTPVSLIEAMALGLPIVSTNVGGIPYLIEDGVNGLLVDPEDPVAMADKIKLLLENPDLAHRLSINGRKTAESFDWEKVKPAWLELLT